MIYAVLGGFNGGPGNVGHVFRTTHRRPRPGPTSRRTSTCRSTPSRSMAPTTRRRSTPAPTSACCARSTAARPGPCWTTSTSRACRSSTSCSQERGAARGDVRPRRLRVRQARRALDRSQPRERPRVRHRLPGTAVPDACRSSTSAQRDLVIDSVQRLMGSTGFSVLATPGTPLVIAAGEHIDFTVRYDPPTRRARRDGDDPHRQQRSGRAGRRLVGDRPARHRQAGDRDRRQRRLRRGLPRRVRRPGPRRSTTAARCPLRVTRVTSSSPEFLVPARRRPTRSWSRQAIRSRCRSASSRASFGPKAGDDHDRQQRPGESADSRPSPARRRRPSSTSSIAEQRATSATSASASFSGPAADAAEQRPLPADGHGHRLVLRGVRRAERPGLSDPRSPPARRSRCRSASQPTSFGAKAATITVTSDDPTGPKSVAVSGDAPSGKLAVTGSTCIGGVKAGCLGERTHLDLQRRRLRAARHERRLQAPEQALEADQQPLPGDAASRLVP